MCVSVCCVVVFLVFSVLVYVRSGEMGFVAISLWCYRRARSSCVRGVVLWAGLVGIKNKRVLGLHGDSHPPLRVSPGAFWGICV